MCAQPPPASNRQIEKIWQIDKKVLARPPGSTPTVHCPVSMESKGSLPEPRLVIYLITRISLVPTQLPSPKGLFIYYVLNVGWGGGVFPIYYNITRWGVSSIYYNIIWGGSAETPKLYYVIYEQPLITMTLETDPSTEIHNSSVLGSSSDTRTIYIIL